MQNSSKKCRQMSRKNPMEIVAIYRPQSSSASRFTAGASGFF
jgi:hypothetical protein